MVRSCCSEMPRCRVGTETVGNKERERGVCPSRSQQADSGPLGGRGEGQLADTRQQSQHSSPPSEMLDKLVLPLFSFRGRFFFSRPLSFAPINQDDGDQTSKGGFLFICLFVCLPDTESHSHDCVRSKGFMPRPWEELRGSRTTHPLANSRGA